MAMNLSLLGLDLKFNGKVKMNVPSGTQSGTVFRLKGKGMTDLGGHGRGNEHVRVIVETPRKLAKQQEELLEEFESLNKGGGSSKSGLFDKVTDAFGGA